MIGVAQFWRIVAGSVNPDAEVLDACVANRSQRQAGVFLDVGLRDEIRWDSARMRSKFISDRLKPRSFARPQGLVCAEFALWGNGALSEIDSSSLGKEIVGHSLSISGYCMRVQH